MLAPKYKPTYPIPMAPPVSRYPVGMTPPYVPNAPMRAPQYTPTKTGAGGNPFAAMLTPAGGTPPPQFTPAAQQRSMYDLPPAGGLPTGPTPVPRYTPPPPPSGGLPMAARNPWGGDDPLVDDPITPGGGGPTGGSPVLPPPVVVDPPPPVLTPPPDVLPDTWKDDPAGYATAKRWLEGATAEGYGTQYQWLLTDEGRQAMSDFHRDAANLRALGITNINFTDWARMEGHNSPIDRGTLAPPSSHTKMGGSASDYETMVRWLAHGAAQYGADAMKPYAEHLARAPGSITAYHNELNYAKSQGFKEFHYADWLQHQGGARSPLAGQISAESTAADAAWQAHLRGDDQPKLNPNPIVRPPGPGQVPPPPPTPTPTPTPQGGPAPPPPPVPVPPPGPPQVVTPPPPIDPGGPLGDDFEASMAKQIADYEQRMNPLFQQQRDDIQRRTSHLGAITGAINSGGFGETLNDALSQQYAQEQATVAPQIAQMSMQAQALALDKFKANLSAILTREQIASNADLERSAQALQKYGIDENVLLEKYKQQLQLKGVQYSADKQVDAAALHAAASSAAAQAQSAASMYATDMRYRTDLFQGDILREGNIMDYILGLGALNQDWMELFLASDPFGFLTGNQPPGQVVIQP